MREYTYGVARKTLTTARSRFRCRWISTDAMATVAGRSQILRLSRSSVARALSHQHARQYAREHAHWIAGHACRAPRNKAIRAHEHGARRGQPMGRGELPLAIGQAVAADDVRLELETRDASRDRPRRIGPARAIGSGDHHERPTEQIDRRDRPAVPLQPEMRRARAGPPERRAGILVPALAIVLGHDRRGAIQ